MLKGFDKFFGWMLIFIYQISSLVHCILTCSLVGLYWVCSCLLIVRVNLPSVLVFVCKEEEFQKFTGKPVVTDLVSYLTIVSMDLFEFALFLLL